jgi:hypothetical protein
MKYFALVTCFLLLASVGGVQACCPPPNPCIQCPPSSVVHEHNTYVTEEVTEVTEVHNSYSSGGGNFKSKLYEAIEYGILRKISNSEDYSWIKWSIMKDWEPLIDLLDLYFATDDDISELENQIGELKQRIKVLEEQEPQQLVIKETIVEEYTEYVTVADDRVDLLMWLLVIMAIIMAAETFVLWRKK